MRKKVSLPVVTIVLVLFVVGILGMALAIYGVAPGMSRMRRGPMNMVSGREWSQTPLKQRVDSAELIVLGMVRERFPSRWNTPTGRVSQDTPIEKLPAGALIFTDYLVDVERVFKGQASGDTVRVRTLGGGVVEPGVGEDRYTAEEEAQLEVGQRVVLFLTSDEDVRTRDIIPQHYRIVMGYQGMYKIAGDRTVSRDHSLPLSELEYAIRNARGSTRYP